MIISRCPSGSGCLNPIREVCDSTVFKVNTLVTCLLFICTLTLGCVQVNAIATYTMLGFSVAALLTTCILLYCNRRERVGEVILLEPPASDVESSVERRESIPELPIKEPHKDLPPLIVEESEEESFESPILSAKIRIVDRSTQLDKFNQLLRGSDKGKPHLSCFEIGKFNTTCDQYNTGFPSDSARICLSDNTPTNGAYVWEKLILIQGPHCEVQVKHLWRIAAEKKAGAIIRLGPLKGYKFYCPKETPLCYENLKIESLFELPKRLFHSTICMNYTISPK